MNRVLSPLPQWTIDQMDSGHYFLKIVKPGAAHSSEGLGEGLVSLFFIIDALYDSEQGDTIVIDEPELSLHPSLQRRLASVLTDYASSRQIVLATHSPYFINLEALKNGATVARTYQENQEILISQLSANASQGISKLLSNYNNPHIWGLKAQEVFFLEDQIILVEGQEDVIFYQMVQEQIEEQLNGVFYGWGVGGADNMQHISHVLNDLGFRKVVGVLDGDKKEVASSLGNTFLNYHFFAIPADDIRTKQSRSLPHVKGLLDESKRIRSEYFEETKQLFASANAYLRAKT